MDRELELPKPFTKEDGEKTFDRIKENLFNDPIVKAFLTSTTFGESVSEQKDVLSFSFHDTHCVTIVKYSDYCFFVQEMGEEDSCWDHESFALPDCWDRDAIEIIIRKIANRFKDHVLFDLYYLTNTKKTSKWKQVPDYSENLDDIIYDINTFPRNKHKVKFGRSFVNMGPKIPKSNDGVDYALVISGIENPNENMIPLHLGKDVFADFYKLK
jgi:hypothetical protein